MPKIICATDFNPVSINAARYAAAMAAVHDMDLELVHIFPIPATGRGESSKREMREEAEREMTILRDILITIHGDKLNLETTVHPGEVIDELKRLCDAVDPWLVIMGIEKADAFERFLLGNTSLRALQSIDHPLLVVPSGNTYSIIKKIGLACDLLHVEKSVPVTEIEKIVTRLNCELHVIHVSHTDEKEFQPGKSSQVDSLKSMLSKLNPEYHFIANPNIEKGIDHISGMLQLDMMIVIPAHRSLLKRLFHPSHSERVAGTSKIPLLSLHA